MTRTAAELAPDPVERRSFLNRTMIAALAAFGAAFGAGSIAVLWPGRKPGFGNTIVAGKAGRLRADLEASGEPMYFPEGRFYLVAYDTSDPDNVYVRNDVAKAGILAIYQKCSHLGCRVPYCPSSGLFECPCHSAAFNVAGEWLAGPAPAGMWHFRVEVDAHDNFIVDTQSPTVQQRRGVDSTGQRPSGAHCVRDIAITS